MAPHPSEGADAVPRRWPVRLILIGVVLALTLPGLLFAGLLAGRIAVLERTRAEESAAAAALRAADALDRELANLAASLRVLATSPALVLGHLDVFADQARATATTLGQAFVLSDPGGRQLVNTRLPPGAALPHMAEQPTFRAAVSTRRTVASDLFRGPVTDLPQVAVMYPVVLGDEVRFVLAVSLEPSYLSDLLRAQGLPPGWRATVADGRNRVVARSLEPGVGIGDPAPPSLDRRPEGGHEVLAATMPGGNRVLVAIQGLRLADWRVGVAVAMQTVDAPLRATLRWLTLSGLAAVAVASLLGWHLARSVAVPLHRLAEAGRDLGAGLAFEGVPSRIAEVDTVSRAMVRATHDLRARAEALAAERARLAAVIDTVPVGLLIADATGKVLTGNAQLDAITRHGDREPDAASSTSLSTSSGAASGYAEWITHHADGLPVRAGEFPLARVLGGETFSVLHCILRCGDGVERWLRIVAAPVTGSRGEVVGGVAAVLDIDEVMRARAAQARFAERLEQQVAERTEAAESAMERLRDEMAARAATEEQLHQAQKMEAVGQLTGGLAHDFNNLLTVVIGSLDLLRRRAADDRTKRLLDNALDGAGRAATLTARLLAFSRRQPLMPQAVEPNQLVTDMSELLRRTLGETVELRTALAENAWTIRADPNQLENALLNLAVNARDAMAAAAAEQPDRACHLLIRTANVALAADFAPQDKEFQPGDYVRLSVADTGTGMAPEVAARVFEPFFTTKPVGRGTGLGLSQVHGFVRQSGGLVTLDTRPGAGTTVAVLLPRHHAAAPEQAVEHHAGPEGAAPGLVVLLVEDDAGVRHFSAEALREFGHVVLDAGTGPDALRLLDAHPELDVLLTDVVLPQMDGPRLAAEARRRRPNLPVLFASGYTGDEATRSFQLPAGAPLLQKPYTVKALSARLRDVVDAARGAGPGPGAPGRT